MRTAWVIEKEVKGVLHYRDIDNCSELPVWITDIDEAIQFSRRKDAEKFADGDESDIRIVEHGFMYY